jgi:hypothetical protein
MLEVRNVTKEDGLAVAYLLNALNIAKFDSLSGKDVEALSGAKRWLIHLAQVLASQLSPAPAAPAATPPTEGMRVKAAGPIPGFKAPKKTAIGKKPAASKQKSKKK